MEKLIIEVMTRGGHIQERHSITDETIAIGRAFDNDLIIADPFVDEHHLVISRQSDGWEIRDLGSANGMTVGKSHQTSESVSFNSHEVIRIGETRINLYSSSHPVAPAYNLPPAKDFIAVMASPFFAWPFLVVLLMVMTFDLFLESSSRFPIERALARHIPNIILPMLWAAMWALIGRVFRHKASFNLHMSIGALAIFIFMCIDSISGHVEYISNSSLFNTLFIYLANALLAATVLAFSLQLVTHQIRSRLRWIISLSTSFCLALLMLFMNYADQPEFSPYPEFSETLKPPPFQWTPSTPVEPFILENTKLFDRLEIIVEETKKERQE